MRKGSRKNEDQENQSRIATIEDGRDALETCEGKRWRQLNREKAGSEDGEVVERHTYKKQIVTN